MNYSIDKIKQNLDKYIISKGIVFNSASRGNVIYIRIMVLANKAVEIRCDIDKRELKISTKRIIHLVGKKYTYQEIYKSAKITRIDYEKDNYIDIIEQAYNKYMKTTLIEVMGK